jgi:hypothetical protein
MDAVVNFLTSVHQLVDVLLGLCKTVSQAQEFQSLLTALSAVGESSVVLFRAAVDFITSIF